MRCRKLWPLEFIYSTLSKKFCAKEYKQHRENILYEKERSLLPATQLILERTKEADDVISSLLNEQKRLKELKDSIQKEYNEITTNLARTRLTKQEILNGNTDVQIQEATLGFIKPCPGENCKGFLNLQWTCSLCHTEVCSECFETKTNVDDHVCDEAHLESAREIRRSCKNCPKCGVITFRIDGCNQMFCVHCKTSWNWATGNIITGRIHNPHYYEWLRVRDNHGRGELADVQCGEPIEIDVDILMRGKTLAAGNVLREYYLTVREVRIFNHGRYHEPNANDNLDLRIKLLKNEISETRFKILLQRREKSREKDLQIYQLLDMFAQTGTDLFYDYVQNAISYYEFVSHMEALRNYCADQFRIIRKRYSCTTPWISTSWYYES
jgi:hypothetical protein